MKAISSPVGGACSFAPALNPITARLALAANKSSHHLTQIDVSLQLVDELKSKSITTVTAEGLSPAFERVLSQILKSNGIALEVTS